MDLTANFERDHFVCMFATEIIRTKLSESFDTKTVYHSIDELSNTYKEFEKLKYLNIPAKVSEPINDRLTLINFKLQNGEPVDVENDVSIIQDIVDIANESSIYFDLSAFNKIRNEVVSDFSSSSKLKILKTCLLAKLFPHMQGECEALMREKLLEHIKIWIEVWKRRHEDE